MSVTTPSLHRLTPHAAGLLLLAAIAWALLLRPGGQMDDMSSPAGSGPVEYVGMWTLMMAAMMLPSVAPVASMYQRSILTARTLRLAGFIAGYLIVWIAAGVPAYLCSRLVGDWVEGHPGRAVAASVVVFAVCGIYQLTPLKDRCLRHCRSPLSILLHFGSYRGPLRDVRAGAHHGGYCLGCCWSLMALFIAVGTMNIPAMIVLAVVVLAEKISPYGMAISRLVGAAALALAVLVIWFPALAPGLQPSADIAPM